jgi:hypothetical protein
MVKPNWDTEELIENWTLLPTELELLENKVGGNKIGFALLLKHFQLFTRFPDNNLSIPQVVISFVASQINLSKDYYSDFNEQGRSARVYRAEIRRLFDFRIATVQDSEQMIDWLISEILPNERRLEAITEIVTRRWRELQLESPTTQRVERSIKSAIAKHEANFCSQTLSLLTPKAISQIDAYPNLEPVMTRPINWDLIRQQYDQMVRRLLCGKLPTQNAPLSMPQH